jgi:hypothetical protein
MCREDDFGQVVYEDFVPLLQQLRIDALHNAAVETDTGSLMMHLLLVAKTVSSQAGIEDNVLPIWDLRTVLKNADQLCLSRMQIHVILSILHPDERGDVELEYFLRVCCTVIPQMFDTTAFVEKAHTIAKERAELVAKQEMEELQGITSGGLSPKRRGEEEDAEENQANAPDRDAVEKELMRIGSQADEKHSPRPTLDQRKFLDCMRSDSVASCQLSEAELRGFIAEAEIIAGGEIAYVDHIKTWVPIIFELRKSRIYDAVLKEDWGCNATHLVDLMIYEQRFNMRIRRNSQSSGKRRSGGLERSGSKPSSGDGRLTSQSYYDNEGGGDRRSASKRLGGGARSASKRRDSRHRRSISRQSSMSRQGSNRNAPRSRSGSTDSLESCASAKSAASVASRRSFRG